MPITGPTPSPPHVRVGDPVSAGATNALIATIHAKGGVAARSLGVGSRSHGSGGASVRFDPPVRAMAFGTAEAEVLPAFIVSNGGHDPDVPVRAGLVLYTVELVGYGEESRATLLPTSGRDVRADVPIDQQPKIYPRPVGEACFIVRYVTVDAGANGDHTAVELWIATERKAYRVCGQTP